MPGAPTNAAASIRSAASFTICRSAISSRPSAREITLDDIEHFAHFTGDTFYAHMDEEAAQGQSAVRRPRRARLSDLGFAAGLFVDPDPGPVLANYGLDNLRFVKPVKPGEAIQVALTVKDKTLRKPEQGEVRWDVVVTNRERRDGRGVRSADDERRLTAYEWPKQRP